MNDLINDVQENVRRFNKDEEVWRCFDKKRERRKALLPLLVLLKSPPSLNEEQLDQLDWLTAERETGCSDCIGKALS